MRALLLILDSVGCGGAPDAAAYGDEGSDTLGHIYANTPGFALPNLERLGLGAVMNAQRPTPNAQRPMPSIGVACIPWALDVGRWTLGVF